MSLFCTMFLKPICILQFFLLISVQIRHSLHMQQLHVATTLDRAVAETSSENIQEVEWNQMEWFMHMVMIGGTEVNKIIKRMKRNIGISLVNIHISMCWG